MTPSKENKMNNQQYKEFLVWLINRLRIKFNEDEQVIATLQDIIDNKKIIDERINVNLIDRICNKYYPGFDFENTDDLKIGYTNHEKKEIYSLISSVIIDTLKGQE